ncbi:hypothetical protein S83_070535 [Arachis hypogaea]
MEEASSATTMEEVTLATTNEDGSSATTKRGCGMWDAVAMVVAMRRRRGAARSWPVGAFSSARGGYAMLSLVRV